MRTVPNESELIVNLNEAAGLLNLSREQTKTAIEDGVELPKSKKKLKLKGEQRTADYEITESDLDAYIEQFEEEEPGRHPPAAVRRELLVEARHRCAICVDSAPLQYHHMIDWAKLKHHDPKRMLAICGTCHDRCTKGHIDYKSQQQYKSKLLTLDRRYSTDCAPHPEKRNGDLKQLLELFSQLHTGELDTFFYDASRDLISHKIFIFWEGFRAVMDSTTLFFHDKMLLELCIEFYQYWERTMGYSRYFQSLASGWGYKFSFDDSRSEDQHLAFHSDLANAEAAFRLLYEYIREEYPEFDFSVSNQTAWENNRRFLIDEVSE